MIESAFSIIGKGFLSTLGLLIKLAAPVAAFFWAIKGEKLKQEKANAKHSDAEAKAWANRPRSDDEFSKRLRDKANKLRD